MEYDELTYFERIVNVSCVGYVGVHFANVGGVFGVSVALACLLSLVFMYVREEQKEFMSWV